MTTRPDIVLTSGRVIRGESVLWERFALIREMALAGATDEEIGEAIWRSPRYAADLRRSLGIRRERRR